MEQWKYAFLHKFFFFRLVILHLSVNVVRVRRRNSRVVENLSAFAFFQFVIGGNVVVFFPVFHSFWFELFVVFFLLLHINFLALQTTKKKSKRENKWNWNELKMTMLKWNAQRKSHNIRFVSVNAVEKSSNDAKIVFVYEIATAFTFHLLSTYNCVFFVCVRAVGYSVLFLNVQCVCCTVHHSILNKHILCWMNRQGNCLLD